LKLIEKLAPRIHATVGPADTEKPRAVDVIDTVSLRKGAPHLGVYFGASRVMGFGGDPSGAVCHRHGSLLGEIERAKRV
jgi:hypothetical protein